RQPDSASATPAARPAKPPPITITLFKDGLFFGASEARLSDKHHFFRFGEPDAFSKNGEVERFNARKQRAIGVYEEPKRCAAVGVDEAEERGALFVGLPGAVSLEAEKLAHSKCGFVLRKV